MPNQNSPNEVTAKPPVQVLKVRATKPELLYANHDPAHCLAPGLFRSLPKGQRETMNLNLKYRYNEDTLIEFSAAHALGVDDLRVLQGLVALASKSKESRELITHAADGVREVELRKELSLEHDATGKNVVSVQANYRELVTEIGYADSDGGGAYRAIRASIERLWKVSIIVQHKKKREGYRLISKYSSDEDTGVISVAFNPRLTVAILAPRREKSYFRIDMTEVRALKTDPARLLHQRLHWLPTDGEGREILLDTLCEYVWPGVADDGTMRKRRHTVTQALEELVAVGWHVERVTRDKLRIRRPVTVKRAGKWQDADAKFPGAASETLT